MSAINITEEDIQYAERILLPDGKTFGSPNSERCNFIKHLESMDLQAVPGSGKTTALLAKLLILEKYMPFKHGSGVLVISHTNAAIDEIEDRIGAYCPRLFSYPNYVGTIQSFVDRYLTIPCVYKIFEKRIDIIDTERFKEKLWQEFQRIYWDSKYNEPGKLFWARQRKNAQDQANRTNRQVNDICNELIEQEVKNLYFDYIDQKIKLFNDGATVLADKNNIRYQGIKYAIENVLRAGLISYDYAYVIGMYYLDLLPQLKIVLQKRFKYVFVDEMQDMDKHQYEILDKLFYDDGRSTSIYQRIGDKNQAIYSRDVKLDNIWSDRNVFRLSGSYRLTREIGSVVQPFALDSGFIIEGENVIENGPILPHLLIFENSPTECHVIQKYVDLVKLYQAEKKIPNDNKILSDRPIAAIAWRKEHDKKEKICLKDYCPGFMQDNIKPQADYDCLESFLIFFDKKEKGLKAISQNIINAILKVIRISGIKDEDRYFTKKRLFDYMMDNDKEQVLEFYDELQRNLYEWSISVIRGESVSVFLQMQDFVRQMFKTFWPGTTAKESFLNTLINMRDINETPEASESRFDCDRC